MHLGRRRGRSARHMDVAADPDQGAWEEVLTVNADDADNLQDLLTNTSDVHYDIDRRTLIFGVTLSGN
jgi:hypothetical protein